MGSVKIDDCLWDTGRRNVPMVTTLLGSGRAADGMPVRIVANAVFHVRVSVREVIEAEHRHRLDCISKVMRVAGMLVCNGVDKP
jgi:hypothetical protein